ncbi:MAG: hypothetical protein AABY98_00830, partial [Candidatus Deferrimicrobiota bacterium]
NVTLPTGESTLLFMDVASQVIPSSVSVRSVKEGDAVSVLEQNYEYDLLSAAKLLEKYVGRAVRIRYRSPYTDREDEKEDSGTAVFAVKVDPDREVKVRYRVRIRY